MKKVYLLVGGAIGVVIGEVMLSRGIQLLPSFSGLFISLLGAALIFAGGVSFLEGLARLQIKAVRERDKAFRLTERMLAKASFSHGVLLTSSQLPRALFLDFDRVFELIKEKVSQHVPFEIFVGPDVDKDTLRAFLPFLGYPNFKFFMCSRDPSPHGLLIRGKQRGGLKIEDLHTLGAPDRKNTFWRFRMGGGRFFEQLVNGHRPISMRLTSESAKELLGST